MAISTVVFGVILVGIANGEITLHDSLIENILLLTGISCAHT